MKKILALLMLAVFVISLVPAAFAANDKSNGNSDGPGFTITSADEAEVTEDTSETVESDDTDEETEEEPVVIAPTPVKTKEKAQVKDQVKEKIKERLQKAEKNSEEKLTQLKKEKFFDKFKLKEFKARALTLTQANQAQAALLKAKQKFDAVQAQHLEAKKKFLAAKEVLAECTGDCTEEETAVREEAQAFLTTSLELMEGQLAKTEAAIEGSEELTAEEAQTSLEEINAEQAEIADLKEEVAAIDQSTDKEDVVALAEKVKDQWQKTTKAAIQKQAALVITNRIGGIIVKSTQLENKLNKVMTRMADQGIDTAVVEPLVTEFNAKLEEAKTAYNAAQTAFQDASTKTGEARNAALKTAQEKMKLAHQALQDAHKLLKDIYQELKGKKADKILTEVEAEDETGEDTAADEESSAETTDDTETAETEDTETTEDTESTEDTEDTESTETGDNETGITA